MAKRILTVDDSKTMRQMVSSTLRKAGFDVNEAEDGKKALTVLSAGRFDLIITDLNMPNMDGISLIKTVRANPLGTKKGYDPYDSGRLGKKPPPAKKDLRKLSEWLKLKKQAEANKDEEPQE